jgi:hypothetical protein
VRNGGVISGELKELDRGRPKVSTDAMSAVQVDREKLVSLHGDRYFEFEFASGN